MMGVPLAIVNQERLLKILTKAFKSEDPDAACEFDTSVPDAAGNVVLTVKVKVKVAGVFAGAVLRGHDPVSYNPAIKK